MTRLHVRFKAIFIRSWWLIALLFLCLIFYEHRLKEQEHLQAYLKKQLNSLQQEKKNALMIQENLELQINSQSDPAWIELMLMKGLGLTPEGQIKVFFDPDEIDTNSDPK